MNNDVHVHPRFGYCTSLVGVCQGFGTRSTLQPFDSQAQKTSENWHLRTWLKPQQIKVRVVNQRYTNYRCWFLICICLMFTPKKIGEMIQFDEHIFFKGGLFNYQLGSMFISHFLDCRCISQKVTPFISIHDLIYQSHLHFLRNLWLPKPVHKSVLSLSPDPRTLEDCNSSVRTSQSLLMSGWHSRYARLSIVFFCFLQN